jgi:ubiquinone/menaquinone biosynthesis C-methylase UbiE
LDYNQKKESDIFQEIADFWSFQLNNEIYLRNHPSVIRGSKEYFDIILSARKKFMYYFPSMISFLKKAPARKFLEVGCGMGTDALVFAQEGFDVTGIDLSPAHLEMAERLFNLFSEKGRFLKENAENLPFPDNSFDSVYSYGVLHHSPNTGKSIREIYRVLATEGLAVIMLYNKWSLNNFAHWITQKGFESVKDAIDAPITQRFSKIDVQKMCSDFSVCNIKTEYLCGAGWGKVYDFIPKPIYLLLSKVIGWHLVAYLEK